MSKFTIYPAIDMRQGQVVRLQYGDPDLQTVFGDDPAAAGQRWLDQNAEWLHVVNLDGAFGEKSAANWEALPRIAHLETKVQFGGGVRTLADVERALEIGIDRVILGTVAVEQPDLVAEAIKRFGAAAIAVGLDAREGIAKTHGWQSDSGQHVHELGKQMADLGVQTVIHTDIGRDGVLTGVNWEASEALAIAAGLDVIASGGVAALDDIQVCLQAEGVSGVITGRAIYDGRLDLAEAIAFVQMVTGE